MKILSIHSDFIEYEPVSKAIKTAEEVPKEKVRVDDCLVIFSAVEKSDEAFEDKLLQLSLAEIGKLADMVKSRKIVLYPFVHLTPHPSSPDVALRVIKAQEDELKKQGFEVHRAPFGWYKKFDIKCKGHPLSELSREITPAKQEVSEAIKAEEKLKSTWFILTPAGKLSEIKISKAEISGFDFKGAGNLEKLASYEMAKVRAVTEEPPHVKYMRSLELVDYEPGSDPGNLRYYPKGRMIKALLEQYVNEKINDYGGMEIESPIMYDFEHPSLKKYLQRFPARQYIIETPNKRVFLRFAACFGQFLMAHDMTISYKQLPLKLYELTRYSFRVEQRGELTGLRRLRAFTMPDCHAFCADLDQAKKEMLNRFDMQKELQQGAGFEVPGDFELALRVTKDFWDENKEFIVDMVKSWGKPALIEMWDKRFFYFLLKYEWNFIDNLDKAAALNTDQIDIENGERYDINYVDQDGQRKHPLILHMSPSGAIERMIYAFLEKAHFDVKAGKPPMLPLWISPTQVRIIPVSEDQLAYCKKLLKSFDGVRADLDDRGLSLGKKIRDAEMEWVPYVAVVGQEEKNSGNLTVRVRKSGKQSKMTPEKLVDAVKKECKGKPFRKLPLPVMLSKRPVFVG